MEIQKLKALKEERFFKARNLNGGARTNRLQNNGLFAPSRLFALEATLLLKLSQTVKNVCILRLLAFHC